MTVNVSINSSSQNDLISSAVAQTIQPPDKISLWSLSFFRSNLALYAGIIILSAAAVISLPYLAIAASITIPAYLLTIFTVAVISGNIATGIALKHRLIFDISLIYTMLTQQGEQRWWSAVSKDVILGALPMEKHAPQLKNLGVTHVITLLDKFELEKGLVTPATKDFWEKYNIHCLHEEVADFKGVPADTIQRTISYMNTIRSRNPDAKFYIHCKAGRGRSAAITVADQVYREASDKMILNLVSGVNAPLLESDTASLVQSKINYVKEKRNQINLNPSQQKTLIAACGSMVARLRHLPVTEFDSSQLNALVRAIRLPGNPPSFSQLYSLCVEAAPDPTAIKSALEQLIPMPTLNYFYQHLWIAAGRPDTEDSSWGERHLLDDPALFQQALLAFAKETLESHPLRTEYSTLFRRLSGENSSTPEQAFADPLNALAALDIVNNPRMRW